MKGAATLTLLAALSALPAHGSPDEKAIAAWSNENAATVEIRVPGSADTLEYEYEMTPSADSRIRITSSENGKVTKGTLMLVSGMLLVKDMPITPGHEIDTVDAPALVIALLNKLLAFGTGGSPADLRSREAGPRHGRRNVDLTEDQVPLEVDTPSASSLVAPPWRLRGYIEASEAGVVKFDLTHITSDPGGDQTMRYVGRWEERQSPPSLPDTLSISGWRVFRLGPVQRTGPNGQMIRDYAATPIEGKYATLGALRAFARSEPGAGSR